MKVSHLIILLIGFGQYCHAQIPEWKPLGPFEQTIPQKNGLSPHGIGKVQCLAVKSRRKIYVGTNTAGVWRTRNKGKTWSSIWDWPYYIGIQDIEIHPKKKRTIFVATGSNPYNNKNYGFGVMVSKNGGRTWDTTGLNFNPFEYNQRIIRKVRVHPKKKNVLIACSDDFIYLSKDRGRTWKVALEHGKANFMDIEFDPFNEGEVHVLGSEWYISSDYGNTWKRNTPKLAKVRGSTGGYHIHRMEMEFSEDQEGMYALIIKGRRPVYVLTVDGGESFTPDKSKPAFNFRLDEHVNCIEFIDDSKSIVFGGVRIGKLELGTTKLTPLGSRNSFSKRFIHDDIRELQVYKGSIYAANDGGIAKWREKDSSWVHMTGKGLTISQFYGISNCEQLPYQILGGTQDMSSQFLRNGTWYNMTNLYGDGGKALQHPDSVGYLWSVRSGTLFHTKDTGRSWLYDNPRGARGPFNSIVKYHSGSVYYASNGVYVKNLKNAQWSNTTKELKFERQVSAFDVYEGNKNCQLVALEEPIYNDKSLKKKLYRTKNGGLSWEDITSNLPILAWRYITDVVYHPKDSNQIWVSLGLFDGAIYSPEKSNKVYYSKDGGETWINQSYNLPNFPTTCLFVKGDYVFLGTDVGLFYKEKNSLKWLEYGNGLPNVYISEIVYNRTVNKLRVATFAMGIWEVDYQFKE